MVKEQTVESGANGRFKGSFSVNVASDCFVVASLGGAKSNKSYFRVR